MLSVKRLLSEEDDVMNMRASKKAHVEPTEYTAFGPIPIEWFDPSLFPKTAMVTVFVPKTVVEQVIPMSVPCSPASLEPSSPFEMSIYTEPLKPSFYSEPLEPSFYPEPSFNHELLEPTFHPEKTPVSYMSVPLPTIDCETDVPTCMALLKLKEKSISRVVFGKKTDVSHILSLLDVPVYSGIRSFFSHRMLLESIPMSMVTKRRNMELLLGNCENWNGVGVLTMMKESKHLSRHMFTSDLTSISQYVRPLGFGAGELILPSNAVCYTSYNKGNRQVTYILTDVLKYADIVRYNKTTNPKSKRKSKEVCRSTKGIKRFSYGMTVLKHRTTPLDVQFSLLTLMSLSFFLLRKWCRSSTVFLSLLDPNFLEPTFEDLSASLIKDSADVLSIPFTDREIHLLLKRANCLFKKLVQLFIALYPTDSVMEE